MARVAVLIDHPNLDILMQPVIAELLRRGVQTDVLVAGCGLTDRLDAAGVAYTKDEAIIDDFLADPQPRLFLNGADLVPDHQLGMTIDSRCFQIGVPSLTLEHAPFAIDWDAPFPANWKFAADRMALVGSEDLRHYREIGVRDERLVVTGLPQYDSLPALRDRRAALTPGNSVTLFGRGHTFTGPHSAEGLSAAAWGDIMHDLIAAMAAIFPDASLRIKPHPAEPFHGTENCYVQSLPDDLRPRVDLLTARHANEDIFLESGCVLTFSASVMLEATLVGVPVVFLDHLGHGEQWHRDMAQAGIVVAPCDRDGFAAGLIAVLPELVARLEQDVTPSPEFIAKYVGFFDGGSAARVCDVVERMIAAVPAVQA